MKIKSSMKLIIAMAVAAIAATSAKASQVPRYNNGDLLLGFYDTTGTITNDYIVDLGPISGFNFNTNFTLSLGLNTDLTNVFGSSWSTSSNIVYGLVSGDPLSSLIYASNPNTTPWTESANQGDYVTAIANTGAAYGLQTQANGETYAAGLEQSASGSTSWASESSQGFGNYFGGAGDGAISDITSNSIAFDKVVAGAEGAPSSDLGSFSLSSAGDVSFTTAAVPEPSTFAAIGLGAAVLAFARRRSFGRK